MSHVSRFYEIRAHLQDFELTNIAGLIATAWTVEQANGQAAAVLRERAADGRIRH